MVANEFKPVDDIRNARLKKKERQAFYTPLSLCDSMASEVPWGAKRVLEPSAGDGRIVHMLLSKGLEVSACELDPGMHARCAEMGADMIGTDFLQLDPSPTFDFIVMNPPFRGKQASDHIEHAYRFLGDNGELVSVVPTFMVNDLIDGKLDLPGCVDASFERLGSGVFKESGTGASVSLLRITRHQTDPTMNACLTAETTQRFASGDFNRRDLLVEIGNCGGSVYGIDWDVVDAYLKGDGDE